MIEVIKQELQTETERMLRNPIGTLLWNSACDRVGRLAAILRDLEVAAAAARFDGGLVAANPLDRTGGPR